ncbi:reverse transcriptase [Cucumis melo var. makuwa]|uniref:Reverse transcriptase n=1 Tax=Cucumis melo var. makuwa TaxID=1194695 RepID=A0A5A7TV11_CUCMM|nr:reverse transcriptase [Cucumis melo var. makuwa]
MDDFDVVLGLEFLLETRLKMILAMQLKKGLTRDELTFMAIPLDPSENQGETVPKDIICVLEKYRDVMPIVCPNLRSGYYQVRCAEGDEPKTTCVIRYRSFEFLVMPFSFTNASTTFCTLMNQSVAKLGWKKGRLMRYVTGQYQNQFQSYAPSSECQAAFNGLKQAMMEGPVLGITDVAKPFEVETDVSNYALGRTYALLKKSYFWQKMRDDVMQYTKTCLICQQDKVEKVKVTGLLNPLPVPARPWESVSMDFITHLPKAGDFKAILVIVY